MSHPPPRPPLPPLPPLRSPPPPFAPPFPQPFDEVKAQAYPNEPDLILMLLLPSALAGFLAVGRLARSRYIDSFEHLSSSYDKPTMSSQLGTLGSITLALVQLLMYGAFLNRFASAGTELTVPWFNSAVLGQLANYFVTVFTDYIKLFYFATEIDMPSRLRSMVVVSKATTPSVAMGTVTARISTAWLLRAMCLRLPPPATPIIRDYVVFYNAFQAVSIVYGSLTLFESIIDETRIISSDNRYLVFESPGKIHLHSYIVHSIVAACCMAFGMAHIYTMEHVDLFSIPPDLAPFMPADMQGARDFFFSYIDIISGCTLASSTMCWITFFVLILRRSKRVDKLFLGCARACVMFNLLQQFFNSLLLGMTLAADNLLSTLHHDMSVTPWWARMQAVSIASFVCTSITQIHFQLYFMPEVAV